MANSFSFTNDADRLAVDVYLKARESGKNHAQAQKAVDDALKKAGFYWDEASKSWKKISGSSTPKAKKDFRDRADEKKKMKTVLSKVNTRMA